MIHGRAFDEEDRAASPPLAILNQSAAQILFPNEDAVGKRLKVEWGPGGNPIVEVVGVVADIRHDGVSAPPDPCLFMPNDQQPFPFTSLVVRTTRQSREPGERNSRTGSSSGFRPGHHEN